MSTENSTIKDEKPERVYSLRSAAAGGIGGAIGSAALLAVTNDFFPLALIGGALGSSISTSFTGITGYLGKGYADRKLGTGVVSGLAASLLISAGSYVGGHNSQVRTMDSLAQENGNLMVLEQRDGDRLYFLCDESECIDLETKRKNELESVVDTTEEERRKVNSNYDAMISVANSRFSR